MPQQNPVAFSIFGIDIMWYGIIITFGILVGMALCYKRATKHNISKDHMLNFVIITLPVAIIGARLYYVTFNWDLYDGEILKIINIRLGGLAIHGGLIFALITILILCAAWKIRPLNLIDLVVPSLALAQSIGRWGNYFNSEAHGGPTDLPWGVIIDGSTYHPTFLYESIWCFFLFILLLYVDNRRKFEGQATMIYGILYSVERFFVEGMRTDSLLIGDFKQAQVISVVIIVLCSIGYIYLKNRNRRKKR